MEERKKKVIAEQAPQHVPLKVYQKSYRIHKNYLEDGALVRWK